ncbi:MAG TPA: glycosyltransferase, partial [Paenalcaligenes sp.]|nr:glycosyltransferase [Paenalcaligenes sp.]
MNNSQRTTPARLTEKAAAKLPRLMLVSVGLVYILAGLFFRDPWKSDDVIGIATMLSMVSPENAGQWLLPTIGDFALAQDGPLATWAGALSILAFAPLFEWFCPPLDAAITAARLPNLLWFLMLTFCFWRALYTLSQTGAAQPLALPFGGEPSKRNYGRMIADAGLLLLVATVGIIWRMHETSAVPLSLALLALLFYGWVHMPKYPKMATLLIGLALGASFL